MTNSEFGGFDFTLSVLPIATLRLSKIFLLNNEDYQSLGGDNICGLDGIKQSVIVNSSDISHRALYNHTYENVIDGIDIAKLGNAVEQKSIRVIDFNHDYSLLPETVNSFDPNGDIYNQTTGLTSPKSGKLTLRSINLKGKGGSAVTPPIIFNYDYPDEDQYKGQIAVSSVPQASDRKGTIQISGNNLKIGDIIKFTVNGILYYCTILKLDTGTTYQVLYLDKLPGAISGYISATKTKNPPYNKDAYDMWGAYKSDYIQMNNENISRITTPISSQNTDVWSLRQIRSSLGAITKIDYESDDYNNSVLVKNSSFTISDIGPGNSGLKLTINNGGYDLRNILKAGNKIELLFLRYVTPSLWGDIAGFYEPYPVSNAIIKSVSDNSIEVTELGNLYESGDYGYGNVYSKSPIGGNVFIGNGNRFYGGGIRTKSISISDPIQKNTHITSYEYNKNASQSSGVTSFEPTTFPIYDFPNVPISELNAYKKVLYKSMHKLLTIAREIPSPGVMYEYVTVKDFVIGEDGEKRPVLGKSTYQYEVFNENMLGIKEYQFTQSASIDTRNISLIDYTTRVGNLKRIIHYDDKDKKLNETINHFLHDDESSKSFASNVESYQSKLGAFNYQGLIQERYADARRLVNGNNSFIKELMIMSQREQYPSIPLGTTIIDYKNGTKATSENLAFDFYSGTVIKSLTTDSYGNRFLSEVTPAYKKYPNSNMGLKVKNILNKNMLIQEATNYTFKVDGNNNKIGLVSANVQTWSNNVLVLTGDNAGSSIKQDGVNNLVGNVWRKQSAYKWLYSVASKDGLTPIGNFLAFDFSVGANNSSNWVKSSEITLYNVYSKDLEGIDINGNSATTKIGHNNSKVIVSGGPAKYNEIAFSGAEEIPDLNGKFSGNVSKGDATIINTIAHTGRQSLKTMNGQRGFIYTISSPNLIVGKDYVASVWVKNFTTSAPAASALYYKINGGAPIYSNVTSKKAGDWYLINLRIPGSQIPTGAVLEVGAVNNATSGEVYFDDFRFQPLNSSSLAYVYDPWTGELNYILDNNNLFSKYEYDNAGRLVKTSRETLNYGVKLVAESNYNYGQQYGSIEDWKRTGITRCQLINGVYTGFLEEEQKDTNSKSATYNSTRWVRTEQSANCRYTTIFLYTQVSSGYEMVLQNAYKSYTFSLPISGSMQQQELNILPGNYSVYVRSLSGNAPYGEYRVQVGGNTQSTPTGFSNVNLNADQTIMIYK
ncbi:hypothetical protein D3C80_508660 [compost metagenome]